MVIYVRSYWPERRPQRQRRRADRDAARWTYDEVGADREVLRRIEMRADDGTYLAAVDHAEERSVGANPQEMAADAFEELWRLARCQLNGEPVTITGARILRYDRYVDELTPLHTGVLILSTTGAPRIRAGHHLEGRTV
ncbi:hypothetical protein ACQP2Y_06770 [Actinoplanes sp. CA-051413]|uniref:hypothetical protein n=1 Tax=Actinoplanes sp. CA-051413 TaxID=3239899 RepID=UPI003D98104A